jgi:hypothetical protein
MAYVLIADEEVACLFIRYAGDAVYQDLHQSIDAVASDPVYRALPGRLHDFREVRANVSVDEMRDLWIHGRKRSNDLGSGRRTALVIPTELPAEMARLHRPFSVRLDHPLEIFVGFADAARWLELPPDYADPFPADD